jgi:predicted dehydrogenase
MTSQKILRIGVLGCAKIADKHTVPAINDLNNLFELVGIASRSLEKADAFAKKHSTVAFGSYEALIATGLLDAIYIPLPNSLHKPWIEQSLRNGIHVITEKSLATSLEDAVFLNNLAKTNNLVLLENFQFRFHRQLTLISDLVSKGAIGDLRCLRSSFGFPPFPDEDNIRYTKELGGGALLDAGAYPIKICQHFLGDGLEVGAANLHVDIARGVDIWGGAYLQNPKTGSFAEIAFGFDNFYQCNLDIWGSKGRVTADRIFTAPPGLSTTIRMETAQGVELIKVDADNHFKNTFCYFYDLIVQEKMRDFEYQQNINQSNLIENLKRKANERT